MNALVPFFTFPFYSSALYSWLYEFDLSYLQWHRNHSGYTFPPYINIHGPYLKVFNIAEQSPQCNITRERQWSSIWYAQNMVTLHTLGNKTALFCYVLCTSVRFWKKSPPPQKPTKNLHCVKHGTTWPPHLQFASYGTVFVYQSLCMWKKGYTQHHMQSHLHWYVACSHSLNIYSTRRKLPCWWRIHSWVH